MNVTIECWCCCYIYSLMINREISVSICTLKKISLGNTFQFAGVKFMSLFTHSNFNDSILVLKWHNFRSPLSKDCVSVFCVILLVFPSNIKFWIMLLIVFIAGPGTSIRLAQYIKGDRDRLLIIVILPFKDKDLCFQIARWVLKWLS